VHTTFVRSVDLDEWTQAQIDAMRLGGNDNARSFFRTHGLTQQLAPPKKYTSRPAQLYRQELQKLVVQDDAAVEAVATHLATMQLPTEPKAAPNATAAAVVAQSKATLASENPHAKGKLATPPNSGGLTLKLRPTSSSTSSSGMNLLKKKKKPGTVRALKMNDPVAKDFEEDKPAPVAAPVVAAPPPPPPKQETSPVPLQHTSPVGPVDPASANTSMADSMAKLKAMNTNFFAGM